MAVLEELYRDLRPYAFAIAYRMLGSVSEAEDVVQDAFVRLHRAAPDDIQSPKAYLATVTTRLAIDALRSARTRRESYLGPWLPEPLLTDPAAGPDAVAETADSLSMAFLVVLETLSPVERAVFLLHDVFAYDYAEIAEIVGKTEANCRQLATRARKHVEAGRPRFETSAEQRSELAQRFFAAVAGVDMDGLVSLLAGDAAFYGDGGEKGTGLKVPVLGRDAVARVVLGLTRRATLIGGLDDPGRGQRPARRHVPRRRRCPDQPDRPGDRRRRDPQHPRIRQPRQDRPPGPAVSARPPRDERRLGTS